MVEHIALPKITGCERSISLYSFYGQMLDCSVCNFQSMNSPMELNTLFSKCFCYIARFVTWPDQTQEWTTCKRGLYVKYYCLSETIAYCLKITNCINHTFSVLSTKSMSSSCSACGDSAESNQIEKENWEDGSMILAPQELLLFQGMYVQFKEKICCITPGE